MTSRLTAGQVLIALEDAGRVDTAAWLQPRVHTKRIYGLVGAVLLQPDSTPSIPGTADPLTEKGQPAGRYINEQVQALLKAPAGSNEYGDTMARMTKAAEQWIKTWIKIHPPTGKTYGAIEYTEYQPDQPQRAVYTALDRLKPYVDTRYWGVFYSAMHGCNTLMEKAAKAGISAWKRKQKQAHADPVHAKYPGLYKDALADLRKARTAWNKAKKAVQKRPEFQKIGGIAKLGLPEGRVYRDTLKDVQRMERDAVGHALTQK